MLSISDFTDVYQPPIMIFPGDQESSARLAILVSSLDSLGFAVAGKVDGMLQYGNATETDAEEYVKGMQARIRPLIKEFVVARLTADGKEFFAATRRFTKGMAALYTEAAND